MLVYQRVTVVAPPRSTVGLQNPEPREPRTVGFAQAKRLRIDVRRQRLAQLHVQPADGILRWFLGGLNGDFMQGGAP